MLAAWIDGEPGLALPLSDRGLHYGDGVFTTLRVHARQPCWLDAHVARLQQSCVGLRLPEPDWIHLQAEIDTAARVPECGVIKVLLTRGDGARGYAPQGARGRRLVIGYRAPTLRPDHYEAGIVLRHAGIAISGQPVLAGFKHANRLEQVLARAECDDPAIDEALLADSAGRVICATAANVFARFGNELRTPALTRSGVAGVCRQKVLQSPPAGFSVTVADMPRASLDLADELFLSNAVRGIVPVRALGDHRYPGRPGAHRAAHALMQLLHPALGLPVPA